MCNRNNNGFIIVSSEIYNSKRKLINAILRDINNLKSAYCKLNKVWKFAGNSRKFKNSNYSQYDVVVTQISKKRFSYKFKSI